MKTTAVPTIFLLSFCSGLATAQSLSISVPTPITASASSGAVSQTAVLPAGPANVGGDGVSAYVNLSLPEPYARFGWYSTSTELVTGFVGYLGCAVQSSSGGAASVAPGQLLLELTAPGVTPVMLELSGHPTGQCRCARAIATH